MGVKICNPNVMSGANLTGKPSNPSQSKKLPTCWGGAISRAASAPEVPENED